MKVKTLIVDDEKLARQELSYLLDLDQRFLSADKAKNGREAVDYLKENEYDLVLLDIKMPGFSGMEVARIIKDFEDPPYLVFTTAYDEYAVEAFKLAAVDYLLKPISEERFKETLERVWEKFNDNEKDENESNESNEENKENEDNEDNEDNEVKEEYDVSEKNNISNKIDYILDLFESKNKKPSKVPVEDNGRYKLIDYSSIYYFSTGDKKVRVHTKKNSFPTHLKLKDLEERLPNNFFRIHRSYIVNLNYIKEVIPWFKGKYQVVMDDSVGHEIPVSRTKVKELNKLLNLK